MTAIAQILDEKLKHCRPETANRVEKLVNEIIALADLEARPGETAPSPGRPLKEDPFFADKKFYSGPGPTDCALNHDQYLYGNPQ